MQEILLFGMGIPALVAIVVSVLKALFLPDKYAPWVALGLGIAFSYLATLVVQFPEIVPFIQPLLYGFVVFAASTGIWKVAKNVGQSAGLVK